MRTLIYSCVPCVVVWTLASVVGALGTAGCVEGFRGSNIQIDLSPATPSQAPIGQPPGMRELPANIYFRISAIERLADRDVSIEVQRFEIHKVVDLTSPCFIDVGDQVRFPGQHVSMFLEAVLEDVGIPDPLNPPLDASEQAKIDAATAVQRMANIGLLGGPNGVKVVTTASATQYPPVDADCGGVGLPPPQCRDSESNARRLAICQATWAADPDLFEGTDRVLTSPLSGTTFGFVVGQNPITPTPLGGAQFFVPVALADADQYAITIHDDGADVIDPGTLFLVGDPVNGPRGVRHVHLESPLLPGLVTAEMAVFPDLGNDEVHF